MKTFRENMKALMLAMLPILMLSCGSVKHAELIMFQTVQNEQEIIGKIPVLKIRTDDILSIQVGSYKPGNVDAFQRRNEEPGKSGEAAFSILEGYRVDEEGNIYLPFLGKVKASGKTVVELRQEISNKLIEYITDASVQIRFLNFRVTILGEVSQPNTYTIPNERLTVLEALGMAGDFTDYARRNSVLIIRERNDKREFVRLNLQDKDLFMSPFFYLSPNDLVYVEPLKAKQYATQGDFLQRYSIVFVPIVSLLTFAVGAIFY